MARKAVTLVKESAQRIGEVSREADQKRGEPMAKIRTAPEQQAYERRMRLLYEQLRQKGDTFAREGASAPNAARRTQSNGSK
jgi:hypothetical protein